MTIDAIQEKNEVPLIEIYELDMMSPQEKTKILRRSRGDISEVKRQVLPIIADVRARGDQAILDYLEKFDGVKLSQGELRVSELEIEKAYEKTDPLVLKMIQRQIVLSKKFHTEQMRRIDIQWEIETLPG